MRGEDDQPDVAGMVSEGSPPHARGRLIEWEPEGNVHRITPACAGKTFFRIAIECYLGDHPRMRGEDPRSEFEPVVSGVITPACAGKTQNPWP